MAQPKYKAVCVLRGEVVNGVVSFTQTAEDAPVVVEGEIKGLTPGNYHLVYGL